MLPQVMETQIQHLRAIGSSAPKMLLSFTCLCLIIFFNSTACNSAAYAAQDFGRSVASLPGFDGPLPFQMETGYVGVGELDEFQLFYYFVESEQNPREDPLLVWLTGGPGCSALSGFLFEIGPLTFNKVRYNGSLPTLKLNPYSWTKVASIIFLDSPAGSGFSYASGIHDYMLGDLSVAKLVHQFVRKWLIGHPQFLSNPLYISGDSYSGIFVPIITFDLLTGVEAGLEPRLNLTGYILGNPLTDLNIDDQGSIVPFSHGMGLISDELYQAAATSCNGNYTNLENLECAEAMAAVTECLAGINPGHILEPVCAVASPKPGLMGGARRYLEEILKDASVPDFSCRNYDYYLSRFWANNYSVREALHIRKGTIKEWKRCNSDIKYKSNVPSVTEYHKKITSRGFRALIYSGDHDMVIPPLGTQAWIRSLNYSIIDQWRPWSVDAQVAGFTREYSNNLTFATIKGGGHTAPEWKPKECFNMIKRWLSHTSL